MAEPRRDPETGGRSLAEILREAGIESPTRGRRRRWDDADDTGIRQRRADADADTGSIGGPAHGRRASDLHVTGPGSGSDGRAVGSSTAAIPGLRPSGKPAVPGAPATPPASSPATPPATAEAAVVRERRAGDRRIEDPRTDGRRAEDRRTDGRRAEDGRVGERRVDDPRLSDGRPEGRRSVGLRPDRRAGERRPAARPADDRRPERVPGPAAPAVHSPSTGPIPVVDDIEETDLDTTPQESTLAWLRFGGELVIALAAGVGIYFLFTVIWEQLPHLAVLVAPLAVTGLVAGVGAYRHRMARQPVGPRLLAVLVFAGTLLTVAPAAGLLAAG